MIILTTEGYFQRIPPCGDEETNETMKMLFSLVINDLEEILSKLDNSIQLEDGVTIRDLMLALQAFGPEGYKILGYMAQNHWMEEFMKEAFSPVENDTELEAIEFCWRGEISDWCDEGKTDLNIWSAVLGTGPDENGNPERYSLSFVPINKLMDLKIILNPKLEVYDLTNRDREAILDTNKYWTVGDLIKTFLYEISFYGGPAERQDVLDDLDRMFESIDSQME